MSDQTDQGGEVKEYLSQWFDGVSIRAPGHYVKIEQNWHGPFATQDEAMTFDPTVPLGSTQPQAATTPQKLALHFDASDGDDIAAEGHRAIKKANPVYLKQIEEPFSVETDTGTLQGKAGDYVAYDPLSGHVWPVAASYVELHYEFEQQ